MARTKNATPQKKPRQFRRVWWIPVLRGLLFLVLGVLLLLQPMQDISVTPWLFGVFLGIDGLVLVMQWFTHRKQLGAAWWLAQAVINLGFGAAIILWAQFWDITALGQYWVLVVWVLVLGIASIVGAMYLSRNRDLGSSWMAVFGIVSALFGVTLITQDIGDLEVVSFTCIVLGLFAFVAGAILMVSGFATRAVAREIDNLRKQAEKAGIDLSGGFVLGASGAISTVSQAEAKEAKESAVAKDAKDEPTHPVVVDGESAETDAFAPESPATKRLDSNSAPTGIDARTEAQAGTDDTTAFTPRATPATSAQSDTDAPTGSDAPSTLPENALGDDVPRSGTGPRISRHDDEHSTLEDPPDDPRVS